MTDKEKAMNDITFCDNHDCPLKDNCWRHVQGLNAKGLNWWFHGEWNGKDCRYYMGN